MPTLAGVVSAGPSFTRNPGGPALGAVTIDMYRTFLRHVYSDFAFRGIRMISSISISSTRPLLSTFQELDE